MLSKSDIKVFFSLYLGITYRVICDQKYESPEEISEALAFLYLII